MWTEHTRGAVQDSKATSFFCFTLLYTDSCAGHEHMYRRDLLEKYTVVTSVVSTNQWCLVLFTASWWIDGIITKASAT